MSGGIAVVTDSTAYLPSDLDQNLPITVVPLYVVLDGRAGEEGREVTPEQVAKALASRRSNVTTSRPAPADFVATYSALLDSGVRGIASIHLSSELSGTWDAARLAAEECNARYAEERIRVVDSRTTAMGLGFAVLAAAEAARTDADLNAVVDAAQRSVDRTITLFYVDTLEHLRRGGRIGAAQALVGTALSVKPILRVDDGRIVPLEKVRTASRALGRLVDLACAAAGDSEVDVAVHHLAAAERCAALADSLTERLPNIRRMVRSEVGAAVGAHVGPGLLGVVIVHC